MRIFTVLSLFSNFVTFLKLESCFILESFSIIFLLINKIRDWVEDRQSRIAWQMVNEVSRRKSTTKVKLKATRQEEQIDLWKRYFENLLGKAPKVMHEPIMKIISHQLDIKLGQFLQELDSVLRKNWKQKSSRTWWNTPRSMEDQGIRRYTAPTL